MDPNELEELLNRAVKEITDKIQNDTITQDNAKLDDSIKESAPAPEPEQDPAPEPEQDPAPDQESAPDEESAPEPAQESVDSTENKLNMANIMELLKNSSVAENDTIKELLTNISNNENSNPIPTDLQSKFKELTALLKIYKPVVVDKVKGSNEIPKDLADVARHTMSFFLEKMVDMLDEK